MTKIGAGGSKQQRAVKIAKEDIDWAALQALEPDQVIAYIDGLPTAQRRKIWTRAALIAFAYLAKELE